MNRQPTTLLTPALRIVFMVCAGLGAVGDASAADKAPDVTPSLLLHCTACHGAHRQEAGLDLRSRAAMLKGGKSGPAVVPGKPEQSLILKRIRAKEMPPLSRS